MNATVLIADDDEAMRQLLGASLRRRGFDVDECSDGTELLQKLDDAGTSSPAPDLVITDVVMPGATGLDVLHWIRSSLPTIPVILITAFGDGRIHRRARELGAASVLDKPFDLAELHARVSEVLEPEPT